MWCPSPCTKKRTLRHIEDDMSTNGLVAWRGFRDDVSCHCAKCASLYLSLLNHKNGHHAASMVYTQACVNSHGTWCKGKDARLCYSTDMAKTEGASSVSLTLALFDFFSSAVSPLLPFCTRDCQHTTICSVLWARQFRNSRQGAPTEELQARHWPVLDCMCVYWGQKA